MTPIKERLEAASLDAPNGCREWQRAKNASGYGYLWFQGRPGMAHRAAWIAAHGSIPAGMQVLHKCDNRACINLEHLFLGTNADNVADKVAKNRQYRPFAKGEANGHSKLTDAQAAEILRLALGGKTNGVIAKAYSVSPQTVSLIRNRRTWTHISETTQ